ncbi:hypothetical protein [Spiroplasma sp. DGKH1]|uniref:hypothetical protein n=1 Tax=Spiroplasma sp. DGKH1 TaxID=3050074 RepID=UPI0034C5F91A
MGIFKFVFGEAPHKRAGMSKEQYDQYCAAQKAHYKAIEDKKLTESILESISISGYNFICKVYGKETVDEIWAKHTEVLSSDGTINPVLDKQNTVQDQNNSLKELELKKQILEMELKLQEIKSQENK